MVIRMPGAHRPRRLRAAPALLLGTLLWGAGVVGGFAWLGGYETTPGEAGAPARAWPDDAGLGLDARRPTMVVFLHPRCPCSRATAEGVERLAARHGGAARLFAVFFRPEGSAPAWADTALRARFAAIAGCTSVDDPGGRLAWRFGARTSGHVAAFDARGARLFVGGITAARGRTGANVHEAALERALVAGAADPEPHPVFGCPLGSPARAREEACPR